MASSDSPECGSPDLEIPTSVYECIRERGADHGPHDANFFPALSPAHLQQGWGPPAVPQVLDDGDVAS